VKEEKKYKRPPRKKDPRDETFTGDFLSEGL